MSEGAAEPLAPTGGNDDDDGFDARRVKELAGFLVRAPRRHPWAALVALASTLILGTLAAVFLPRSWGCDTRILAQHNFVLPALDNPNRAVPHEADAPTKNATDAILQRANILAMIKQLDLVERWRTTRQPLLRLKDKILGTSKTDEERLRDMVEVLGSRLNVTSDEASITISIEWPDREIGFEIVSYLQKNFLEARYDTNVNVIVEAIRILEERGKPQEADVDAALAELTKCEEERNRALEAAGITPAGAPPPRSTAGSRRSRPAAQSPAAAAPPAGDGGPAQELQGVRASIRGLKDERARQLSDAQRQLQDARVTLGPLHPTVTALSDKIGQLGEPPPEMKTLEEREHRLVAELANAPEASVGSGPAATASAAASAAPRAGDAAAHRDVSEGGAADRAAVTTMRLPSGALMEMKDDSKTALARQRLQTASAKYNELLSRIEAANIELAVTRAAFKYQYTVIRPPEIARRPSKPNVLLIIVGTILGAALLTLLVPGAIDLMRGRFVEPWQVEHALKLPVLGDLSPRQ